MPAESKWPSVLYVVRHGESAGNVARALAEATQEPLIDIASRDVDVPLSPLGERQAAALGRWFQCMEPAARPSVIRCSPYVRASTTASIVREIGGFTDVPIVFDERLREKEFGILDRLTKFGIRMKHPEQAELRRVLGKFYFRPPGGESWCDVILRLRSVVGTLTREYAGERVLIVAHQVIVSSMRYLLEHMTEDGILAADREHPIANCSVTSYVCDPSLGNAGRMVPDLFNFVAPLEAAGTKVTSEKDAPVAPK
jgi:broad specificity phosphatase PhoE